MTPTETVHVFPSCGTRNPKKLRALVQVQSPKNQEALLDLLNTVNQYEKP